MAKSDTNFLLQQLRGAIGKQLVIKQYGTKTVITAYPDTAKKKKRSPLQKLQQETFTAAVKYAQAILRDPVKKKAYAQKVKKGQQVYHYAISEYKRKMAKG